MAIHVPTRRHQPQPGMRQPTDAVEDQFRSFTFVAKAFAVAIVIFAAWMVFHLGGTRTTDKLDDVCELVAPLIAAVACGWAARRSPHGRLAWALLAASCVSWALGQVVWCYYDLFRRILVPFPSLADVGYLAAVPLAMAGLLAFPSKLRRGMMQVGSVLDALVIAGSLLFISWSVVLGPVYHAHQGGALKQVLSMAYPASDVVMVSIVVIVSLHIERGYRTSLGLVMFGILAFAIADSSFAYFTEINNYGIGNSLDSGWVAGYLLIALGALWTLTPAAAKSAVRQNALMEESDSVTLAALLLPYALVALAGIIAVTRFVQGRPFGTFLFVDGMVIMTVLAIRQVLTLFDNVALNNRLHARIDKGTKELRHQEARYASLVKFSSDPITIIKEDATILYQSPSITRILGWVPAHTVGKNLLDMLHPDDRERSMKSLRNVKGGLVNQITTEWRFRHTDLTWRTFQSVVTNLLNEPSVGGLVLNSRDVTDQRSLEEKIRYEAFHDPLTGLANRLQFGDHLDQAVLGRAGSESSLAVMFIDLNDFKSVNDLRGRSVGDRLLRMVAARLEECVEGASVIARMGGDKFAVLFEYPCGKRLSDVQATRIMDELSKPYEIGSETVTVTASIGLAKDEMGTEAQDELMRHADLAVNAAKSQGRHSFAVYTPALHASILDRMRTEAELRNALVNDELILHYQPIVDARSGSMTGIEAVVRWDHPERGMVLPEEFIPIAEAAGLIVPLGEWALFSATCALQALDGPGGENLQLHVNVSPRQLSDQRFATAVREILENSDLDGRRLTIEVTESLLVEDGSGRVEVLDGLREMGVKVAIDDFGLGYSSLGALRRMPADILKIDKSFVEHIAVSDESAGLLRMMLQLASDLHMPVVAEGVEDPDQAAALQRMGCPCMQGFYFSAPLSPEELQALLQDGSAILEKLRCLEPSLTL